MKPTRRCNACPNGGWWALVSVFTRIVFVYEAGFMYVHVSLKRHTDEHKIWSHVFSQFLLRVVTEAWTRCGEVSTHLQRCFVVLMPPFSFHVVYKSTPMHCSVWHSLSISRYVLTRRLRLKRLHHFIIIPPSGASCPSCVLIIHLFIPSQNHSIHLPCCHESL